MKRVELSCHTGYSIGLGLRSTTDWIRFAEENEIKALGITDIGSLDAFSDFASRLQYEKSKIKLLYGADMLVYDDLSENATDSIRGRVSILIRNDEGKKNLYKIFSEGYRYSDAERKNAVPLSFILDNRKGLLLGSGQQESFLADAVSKTDDETCLIERLSFLNYIEISATETNPNVHKLLSISEALQATPVAVAAPHYIYEDDKKAYSILRGTDIDMPRHYLSTSQMLEMFDFLGREKSYEIVVKNTNMIAYMCNTINPLPKQKMFPYIFEQNEKLRYICENALAFKYPKVTQEIIVRLEWELKAIERSKSAFMFLQLTQLIDKLKINPFEAGSRGMVGSSMVAYLCGITEVDPIKAHLSPYFFFGFDGLKEPDIDLNFAPNMKRLIIEAFTNISGIGRVICAGTVTHISEKTANRMIDEYNDRSLIKTTEKERIELVNLLTTCMQSKDMHPGGLILLPEDTDIYDVFPVVYGCEQNANSTYMEQMPICGFDYHSIDNIIYKFDALSHDTPALIKKLYDYTGADPREISTEDEKVMAMFMTDGDNILPCAGIPEFSSELILKVMEIAKPSCFDDLVKLIGIMHGTGTWLENAEVILKKDIAGISELISNRSDVYDILRRYGMDEKTAYMIAEDVRKGKVSRNKSVHWNEWRMEMFERGVPDWFIWSCERILYLFPKAHCYSYMLSSWRLAWYKLNYPDEYAEVFK